MAVVRLTARDGAVVKAKPLTLVIYTPKLLYARSFSFVTAVSRICVVMVASCARVNVVKTNRI